MRPRNVLNVHIGEVKFGQGDLILSTILGSCVGIALLCKKKGLCGLAHCFLPHSGKELSQSEGRFVNVAIETLLKGMKISSSEDYECITAAVAGGGNMTQPDLSEEGKLVGTQNYLTALEILEEKGIQILATEVGGHCGRKMTVDCLNYTVAISTIPRLDFI